MLFIRFHTPKYGAVWLNPTSITQVRASILEHDATAIFLVDGTCLTTTNPLYVVLDKLAHPEPEERLEVFAG